jgi:hypothetical protein
MLKRGIRTQSLAKSSRQGLWRADAVGEGSLLRAVSRRGISFAGGTSPTGQLFQPRLARAATAATACIAFWICLRIACRLERTYELSDADTGSSRLTVTVSTWPFLLHEQRCVVRLGRIGSRGRLLLGFERQAKQSCKA